LESGKHLSDPDVARRAFDAVAAARVAGSRRELNKAVHNTFKSFGFEAYIGVDVIDTMGRPNVNVLFGKPPVEWYLHYTENGYEACDAVIKDAAEFGFKNGFVLYPKCEEG
jgi:hypothetical protein